MVEMFERLYTPAEAVSRSISHENPNGEPGGGSRALWGLNKSVDGKTGAARELEVGWKIDPWFILPPHSPETEYARVEGSGVIRSIWIVPGVGPEYLRGSIIRFYWDGCEKPAIECPFGDFFCAAQYEYKQLTTAPMCRNARTGYNCYISMPFHSGFRLTVENLEDVEVTWGYQINYELCPIPEQAMLLHACFHRSNARGGVHPVLDAEGRGAFLGLYQYRSVHNNGVWCLGDVEFCVDGEEEPRVRSVGTDGYFGASDCFAQKGAYCDFSSLEASFLHCSNNGDFEPIKRFSLCRWHLSDPVFFERSLRVRMRSVGRRRQGRPLPLQDDISTTAFFYLDKPDGVSFKTWTMDELEVI